MISVIVRTFSKDAAGIWRYTGTAGFSTIAQLIDFVSTYTSDTESLRIRTLDHDHGSDTAPTVAAGSPDPRNL